MAAIVCNKLKIKGKSMSNKNLSRLKYELLRVEKSMSRTNSIIPSHNLGILNSKELLPQ